MDYIIFILLAAILVILLFILLKFMAMSAKSAAAPPARYGLIEEQERTKKRNLELILALFDRYEVLTNAIIRQALGLDDRVIVNYMDELEKLGKVRQVGKTGVNAHYKLMR